jgi:hypothetical protein
MDGALMISFCSKNRQASALNQAAHMAIAPE